MIKLFELRSEKELSQRDMANVLHVSQGTYNNWENGKTEPSIAQLIFLADFFGVSMDGLLGRESEKNGQTMNATDNELLRYCLMLTPKQKSLLLDLLKETVQ